MKNSTLFIFLSSFLVLLVYFFFRSFFLSFFLSFILSLFLSFLISFFLSFFITHNSKTIWYMLILYIPNDCFATRHFPFLVCGGVQATTGELWRRNCPSVRKAFLFGNFCGLCLWILGVVYSQDTPRVLFTPQKNMGCEWSSLVSWPDPSFPRVWLVRLALWVPRSTKVDRRN